jgi:anti-sigma regulatory factor (Ser/Thr protein kinase)
METNLIERPVPGSTVLSLLPAAPQPRASWGWRLGASRMIAYWARVNSRWFLEKCSGVSEDVTETALLVVSELVTNAYTATATPAEESIIELSLRVFDSRLLVEVIDSSPGVPVLSPPADATALSGESGRGLSLVDALSEEWGYFWHDGRKVVYAALSLGEQPGNGKAASPPGKPASGGPRRLGTQGRAGRC